MMLKNKSVLVTGAGGLLGSALCSTLEKEGARVAMVDIDRGRLLRIPLSGSENRHFSLVADTTKPDEVARALQESHAFFGQLDGVVHCAYPCSKGWGTSLENLQPEFLKEDLFGQLGGAILLSQQVLGFFRKNGGGTLIHLSSILGLGAPKFDHYTGTKIVSPVEYTCIKAGIIALVKYLAKYSKNQNIRVNCVSPGGIFDHQPESFLRRYRDSCTSKGMLAPEDVAGAIVFLLSEKGQYINGQNLIVDDGWSL